MAELVFTRPALLWGLMLAVLPVLIHLLHRRRAQRRPFAAMEFLLRVQKLSARKILLRQLLLLLLRTLLVVFLVLAAAGPVIGRPRPSLEGSRTLSALVLDLSYSMRARTDDGRTVFQAAQQKAAELLARASPDNRWFLLAAGSKLEVLPEPGSDSPGALLKALESLRPQWGRSELSAAASAAARLLLSQAGAAESNLRVVLLSDGAAHAFAAVLPAPEPVEVLLEVIAPSAPKENTAVCGLQTESGYPAGLRVELRHFGERPRNGLRLWLQQEGESLLGGFVDLPPLGLVSKRFLPETAKSGLLKAVLEGGDALPEDDQREAWWAADSPLRVLVLNGDLRPALVQNEVYFYEQALAPGASVSDFVLEVLLPEKLEQAALQAVQVVVLANVRELEPHQVEALETFVRSGGGLLFCSGDRVEPEATSRALAPLLALPLRDTVQLDENGSKSGLSFVRLDQQHPVLEVFGEEERAALQRVRVRRATVLETPVGRQAMRVLMELGNGMPALVEASLGAGRLMLLATSLDADWNNWPLRASYVPFFRRLTAYLGGRLENSSPPEVEVDRPLELPWPAGQQAPIIVDPEGVRHVPPPPSGGVLRFTDTRLPGFWRFEIPDQGRAPWAGFFVRPPASESDLRPLAPEQLNQRLGERARLAQTMSDEGAGSSLELWLLLLAAAAVALESLLLRW